MTTAENRDQALINALGKTEVLVDEVKRLRVRNKVYVAMLAAVAIVTVGTLVNAYQARVAAHKADVAVHEIKHVQQVQNQERAQRALETCRVFNSANRSTRMQFRNAYRTIFKMGTPSPERASAVRTLMDSIPLAKDQDRDCDASGTIGNRGDYARR